MSGAIASSFPNRLFGDYRQLHANAEAQEIQNQYAPQAKQLAIQTAQQQLADADTERVARLSQWMLTESNGDEGKMASLYADAVANEQRQGRLLNAPAFPGAAGIRRAALMGTPSADLAKLAQNRAGVNALLANNPPSQTPGATTPSVPGTPAVGPSYAGGIASFEGGGNANPPENPRWPVARGGPAGAHQFIASTWNAFAQANPELFKGMTPEQILAARSNPDLSTMAANWYAGENAKVLQAQNVEPTPGNLGIAHTLGPAGALKVLSAPDNTPLSQVIPETIAQNPQYGRMTVGDLKRQFSRLGPLAPQQAPGAPGGGRVQVASVTNPTTTTDVTTAPVPGQQPTAQTPAQQQQPQQQPQQPATLPAHIPQPGTYTPQQMQDLRAMQIGGASVAAIAEKKEKFNDDNDRARQQWRAEQAAAAERAAVAQRAADAHRLEQEKFEFQKLKAAKGETDADRIRQTLLTIGPKIRDKTATPEEAARYAYDWNQYAYGDVETIPNPDKGAGGTVSARVPRNIRQDLFPPPPGQTGALQPQIIPGTAKPPDMAPAQVISGVLENAKGQAKIAQALASLAEHPESVGATAVQPNWLSQRTDPQGVKVRADVSDVQGHIFHDLAGTAQSGAEAGRLKGFTPDPQDTAEALKTKLQRMLEINRETMVQSYRVYGPEGGYRRQPVVEEAIIGTIPQGAIDHFKKNQGEPGEAARFDKKYGKGTAKMVLDNG